MGEGLSNPACFNPFNTFPESSSPGKSMFSPETTSPVLGFLSNLCAVWLSAIFIACYCLCASKFFCFNKGWWKKKKLTNIFHVHTENEIVLTVKAKSPKKESKWLAGLARTNYRLRYKDFLFPVYICPRDRGGVSVFSSSGRFSTSLSFCCSLPESTHCLKTTFWQKAFEMSHQTGIAGLQKNILAVNRY